MPKQCEVVVYQEDGWTIDKITSVIEKHKAVSKYVIAPHSSDDNKKHFHVYMNFGTTNEKFEFVAKWFKTKVQNIERIKSNLYYVIIYYLHRDSPDKHQYQIKDLVSNFNIEEYLETHQSKQTVAKLIQRCADGIITPYNYINHIDPVTYSRHEQEFSRAWEYSTQAKRIKSSDQRQCHIVWVYGNGGTGKTTMCRLCAEQEQLPAYITAGGKDPFSHYTGQQFVILDDIRPNEPFNYVDLLKLTDPNNISAVHSRYRNKVLFCSHIMITTTLSPQAFAKECLGNSDDDPVQLYRRIEEAWCVSKESIEIERYDYNSNAFVSNSKISNPVQEYLKTLPEIKKIDGASLIGSISQKYSNN